MYCSKIIGIVLLVLTFCASCKGKEPSFDFSQREFLITSNGDKWSAEAADYLYHHLSKRAKDKVDFHLERSDDPSIAFNGDTIYMEIVSDLADDYELKNEKHSLSIFAKDKATMVWLTYMFIDKMAQFHEHIDVSDLVPHYIDFESGVGRFAMSYREPHLLPNMDWDYVGTLGTHHVERDWGIWGHNLKQVFVDGIPESSYALVDGKRHKEQFCFSASTTYNAIKNFVLDEYGDGEKEAKWFMIAPNDNELACTCSACQKAGNTQGRATGSVVHLLNKLAKEYPNHSFFTMAYLTTAEAPTIPMEKNTGVFVSTIDLPKSAALEHDNPEVQGFVSTLNVWKEKTKHIYLWDYISNFDDYLTPYPVLLRLQSQLNFFIEQGVNGMFLNGSGYDYSPFDDVKTYVMAALLHNASLPIEQLVNNYFQRFYPVTGKALSSYYMDLEYRSISANREIPIYLSFRKAADLFFDGQAFLQQYEKLYKALPELGEEERQRIDKLLVAWSYTYLQVLYHEGHSANGFLEKGTNNWIVSGSVEQPLVRLKRYPKYADLEKYKETGGELAIYIGEWERLLKTGVVSDKRFAELYVRELNRADHLPEGTLLMDQVLGFVSDFNQGWFLTANDIEIEGKVADKNGDVEKLVLRFLVNPRHRMLAPMEVELLKDGVSQQKFSEAEYSYQNGVAYLEYPIKIRSDEKLQIKVRKSKNIENSVIACDEIQLF